MLFSIFSLNSSSVKAQQQKENVTKDPFSVQISLIPASCDFGTIKPSSDSCVQFSLINPYFDNLVITNIFFSQQSPDFIVKPIFIDSILVAGGSEYDFSVCYTGDLQNLITSDTLVVIVGKALIFKSPLSGHIQPQCLETVHAISYNDPVVIGGTAEHEFHLLNNTNEDITVSSVLLDNNSAGFVITTPIPFLVPAHSSDKVLDYSFSANSDFGGSFFSTTFATINLQGSNLQCTSVEAFLIGNVAKPGGGSGIDTTLRPLFPSDVRTLAIEGTGKPVSMRFTFTNNLNVPSTISKVYMKDGTYFSVTGTNPSPTPFILASNQTMDVTVNYTATDNLIHTDSLMIEASHNLQTIAFELQGVQVASSVPAALPTGVTLSVLPNPASTYITVNMAGVRSADLQVFDILGKQLVSAKANSFWKWDAPNTADGSYIIRIAGESMSDEHFVVSKKIILSK
jgi:hypothetical protein